MKYAFVAREIVVAREIDISAINWLRVKWSINFDDRPSATIEHGLSVDKSMISVQLMSGARPEEATDTVSLIRKARSLQKRVPRALVLNIPEIPTRWLSRLHPEPKSDLLDETRSSLVAPFLLNLENQFC